MQDWRATILTPDDTMQQAIQTLDREALRIVLVADVENRLLGTITDGDIRRALLKQLTMETKLEQVMFKEPTVARDEDDRESLLAMMKSKDLLQVPILDDAQRIVGLETLHHLLEAQRLDNPVFLMAGGFGRHLRPLTDQTPKPMLKVGNKPILDAILDQFIEAGFHNFFFSTHYKAEMVRDHFGDGSRWNVTIQYLHEEEPLGTAGSLGLLPRNLPDLPVLVMNGDVLTKVNFQKLLNFHLKKGGVASMCVREYDFKVPYGVVKAEGHRVVDIVEKPVQRFFVNAGVYVLESSLVQSVDGSVRIDMPALLEEQIQKGNEVNLFPVHEYWLDVGQHHDFNAAKIDYPQHFDTSLNNPNG